MNEQQLKKAVFCPQCTAIAEQHFALVAELEASRREVAVTEKSLCDAMDALHKSECELAAHKQALVEACEISPGTRQGTLNFIKRRAAELAANA